MNTEEMQDRVQAVLDWAVAHIVNRHASADELTNNVLLVSEIRPLLKNAARTHMALCELLDERVSAKDREGDAITEARAVVKDTIVRIGKAEQVSRQIFSNMPEPK